MFDTIKKFGSKVLECGKKVIQKGKNVACAVAVGIASLTGLPSGATAQEATDATTQINTALTTISGIWDTVCAIMIGVAVVVVALRFFKKAK